ncbi:hypothetical protein KUV26_03780 [Leisingera daeponensis]|uniref:Uncharacterized protein n=1 Tax=Leisingera daeponensis TaxID=405746 RepID=A0ABS7NEN1_9RHOB|nr:hypothetical protein [Leisingera daeponensis]MBY6138546.1 hypothetical protein [Leisingera daeponensis]
METLAGKALNDLANLAADKWYAGLGAIGLIALLWVMLKGTPHDDLLIGYISLTMIGLGFGEAETRTFREHIDPLGRYKLTGPARRWTFIGISLYLAGASGAGLATLRAIDLSRDASLM